MRPTPRYLGLIVLLAMAGFAAVGFFTIRRDVEGLRVISQDNILWSATQMEVELLRFELSLAELRSDLTEEALEDVRERFDILWSRVFLMNRGRVGQVMRGYDEGFGSLKKIATYLEEIDPVLQALHPEDIVTIERMQVELEGFQQELRLYTLRVVRADTAASALVRDRIQSSAQTTAIVSIAAVLLSVLSLFLILRENRRQRELVRLSRQHAEEAELSSRAKSRFLTMMSHELRNPLNGVLGPLALLNQTELGGVQQRLVGQAQQCGRSMLQMLAGLLDYSEMQDGRLFLVRAPFSVAELCNSVREALASDGAADLEVKVLPETPDRLDGDVDRICQIFVHLTEFVLEARPTENVSLSFGHDGKALVGEIALGAGDATMDWKLDLLMGLSDVAADQVSADALRPLISRGLIATARGMLSLEDGPGGRQVIRVSLPAAPVKSERIRIHLETRSSALATIYQAALRSERVTFAEPEDTEPVDVVLVDTTSVGEDPLMSRLRERFPGALFVSLGLPQKPDIFDDVVEIPSDVNGLRRSIFSRVAS
ncbi:MAG TPA: histidine kinase dimerization/phospho-acceptor domain-containing protein [Amaricoccus sp.]|uniref:sensor histidine kinase n=1 Tax=Amaricoccus sp. TaxID=1872485 RepID=UPI002BDCFDCF|nr:histidine kinase dimerization/phospho-acceptor domain-containing protein [Amaricoccus sp.]HMQ91618.1 histidine kinase dimerization/phospho-acceptor domain-containing protein [Amaricoccus sp.]HMR51887.1 histidine kinase dimerization/phospho-acceptor domain-containing protein [Amaricoccus sp.]HMR59096.1 histidine kinase dimerization/phospho-acceptor domain-containing protein [Amaricoccus sp.]HMT98689.1 histidine kinase dimerization/phospho-acceptor domain-containing protein [Amaricoccus sp.]